MSNVFANLVATVNAVGAAVPTVNMGKRKTLTVSGDFSGVLIVEVSLDAGVSWSQLVTFSKTGTKKLDFAAHSMRIRSQGASASAAFTPNIDVAASGAGGLYGTVPAPAVNAVGVALDISSFGGFTTFAAQGDFTGVMAVQISEDGIDWSEICTFTKPGSLCFKDLVAQEVRAVSRGANASAAYAPVVTVGAINDAADPADIVSDGNTTNIYVDSVNGDDGNDGLSTTTPMQTLRAVYDRFPIRALQRSQVIIHLAGVGGFGASATGVADYDITNILCDGDGSAWGTTYHYRGPQMVPVTPATGPATAALDATPVVAVIGGSANAGGLRASRFDFGTAAPGWTVNDFNGKFLRITRAGALVIFEAPIAVNAADSITVLLNGLAAAPDAIVNSDTVEIVEPGARFINDTLPALDFDTCRISGVSTQDADVADGAPAPQAGLSFQRVQFRTSPFVQGAWQIEFDRCALGTNLIVKDGSVFFMCCQVGALSLWNASATGFYTLPNPDTATSPIVANRALFMELQATSMIVGEGYGPASWQSGGSIGFALTPSGFNSLMVGPQSYLQSTGDIQGLSPVAGSRAGIRAAQGGFVQVSGNGTPGRTSVAAAGGDLRVGPVASAYVDYGTGVGDFEEAIGFNGNLQRFPTSPGDIGDGSIITTRDLFA